MRAGITEQPTARPLTEAERIFFEAPHGPDWAARLTEALQREYNGGDWLGPCESETARTGSTAGCRVRWYVRR